MAAPRPARPSNKSGGLAVAAGKRQVEALPPAKRAAARGGEDAAGKAAAGQAATRKPAGHQPAAAAEPVDALKPVAQKRAVLREKPPVAVREKPPFAAPGAKAVPHSATKAEPRPRQAAGKTIPPVVPLLAAPRPRPERQLPDVAIKSTRAPRRAAAKPARGTAGADPHPDLDAAPSPRRKPAKSSRKAADAEIGDAAAIAELSVAGPASKGGRKPRVRSAPQLAPRPAPISRDRLETLVEAVRDSLESDKAERVVVLDVTDRASFTDRMVIATGLVDRQIQAMATHVEEALATAGMRLSRNAIQASPDWVLIDAGDMIIHLFKPEARETYALERMWGPDSPQGEARPEAAEDGPD